MSQGQHFGVQSHAGDQRPLGLVGLQPVAGFQTRQQQRRTPVKFIAHNRQARMAQMHANLVCAPGQRPGTSKAHIR